MTNKEYLMSCKGFSGIRINFALIGDRSIMVGLSEKDENKIFYFTSIKGKISGPYYANQDEKGFAVMLHEKINKRQIMNEKLNENELF